MGHASWSKYVVTGIPRKTTSSDTFFSKFKKKVVSYIFMETSSLMVVFDLKVLDNIVQNKNSKDSQEASKAQPEKEDFDPSIALDNLFDESSSKSLWRGNIQSVQLAAKMVIL